MGVLIRKQKGLIITGIAKLALISFIVALGIALVDTIWAVYMNSFVNSIVLVGYISAALTLVSFLSYFLFIPIIEKSKKNKLYSLTLLLFGISYILFAINTKFYFFIILAFFITILHTLRITCFGIIVKENSPEKQLSRNEGLMYTFMNLAWTIGPLIAGFFSQKFGINRVFLLSALFIFIAFFILKILKVKKPKVKKRIDKNMFKNFFDFFKSKERSLAYFLGGGVNYWWSLIYLFMPLFILERGLSTPWIGYFLFAVAVPLIAFQYYFSKLAGKIGFKKIFKIGFFIPAFFAFICFFIGNIYFILLLLVIASIGLAMLEATTEAYFFDILKGKQDLRFYGPYNTTIEINHFIGRFLSATILIFLPFKFIFLFFSFSMFVFFFLSFKVKNIIESRRDGKRN